MKGLKLVSKLIEKGKIIKIEAGLLRWKNADLGGYGDIIDISHIDKSGVFCLYTAMNFYNLTSFISNKYYFAIPRVNWIKAGLENYPVVIKKWQESYFDFGIDKKTK
ncbi:MAG: type IV toxin-antitoxin system AbiEi family antitoxin domain-containing protein [Promethearchaeota archaeon]